MTSKTKLRRQERREQTFGQMKDEIVSLRKLLAQLTRKVEHGCADASCLICDPEQPEDADFSP